jgi:hypothetical protein
MLNIRRFIDRPLYKFWFGETREAAQLYNPGNLNPRLPPVNGTLLGSSTVVIDMAGAITAQAAQC